MCACASLHVCEFITFLFPTAGPNRTGHMKKALRNVIGTVASIYCEPLLFTQVQVALRKLYAIGLTITCIFFVIRLENFTFFMPLFGLGRVSGTRKRLVSNSRLLCTNLRYYANFSVLILELQFI